MGDMTKLKITVMNYWTSFRSFLNKRDRHKIHKMDKIGQQNKLLKKCSFFEKRKLVFGFWPQQPAYKKQAG